MAPIEFPPKVPKPRSSEELLNSSSVTRTTVVIVVQSAHMQFLVGSRSRTMSPSLPSFQKRPRGGLAKL